MIKAWVSSKLEARRVDPVCFWKSHCCNWWSYSYLRSKRHPYMSSEIKIYLRRGMLVLSLWLYLYLTESDLHSSIFSLLNAWMRIKHCSPDSFQMPTWNSIHQVGTSPRLSQNHFGLKMTKRKTQFIPTAWNSTKHNIIFQNRPDQEHRKLPINTFL